MALSRGLRQQQAANAHAAEHEEFNVMLLAALEDPEIREAIAGVVRQEKATRQRRSGLSVTSASAARDLKASRLAARGRQRG
jgi:hypothetical protein